MVNVLVTGGAGFIGSHTVDILKERGYDVSVLDNLSSGKRDNLKKEVKFFPLDITGNIDSVFKETKPERVLHLAAQASVVKSVKDPMFNAKVNVLGTLNILEACRKHDVRRIVFASTGGALYGNPSKIPVPEDYPIKPISPYGISKYEAELYIQHYGEIYGIEWVNLRYGNVYGPRQDPYGEAGVIAIFANKMLKGERPIIYGDGEQTRDFVYVTDVARANLIATESKFKNDCFNIGTGKEVSVNKVFSILKDMIGYEGDAIYAEERPGEVRRIVLDCKKAEEKLGWRAEVDLEEGIRKFVDFLRK